MTIQHAAIAAACALAFGAFPAHAQEQQYPGEASILRDSQGDPVMSGAGLCWHTGHGPSPAWTAPCHTPRPVRVSQYYENAPGPAYENVTFDANILFDSDKSDLLPLGRYQLDGFVQDIRGLEPRSMLAVGYADRMGGNDENQVLSRDRVETVKDYLVAQGIATDRIQTRARGETRPTTYPSECQEANNAKNIACLQPDRHVFIEVSGTRRVR
jgi:OOP family OmpA-OmpF porin